LPYCFPVDQLVCRFKFSADMACGVVLCSELTRQLGKVAVEKPDLLVPVPLHRTRHLRRNFNQADLLARGVGRALGIPVSGGALRRVRRTLTQSGLDAKSRRKNLRGAFSAPGGKNSMSGITRVALVDDVYTTGSTLLECVRTLKKVGVTQFSVWVAARAPEP
jgi:ComF family protein